VTGQSSDPPVGLLAAVNPAPAAYIDAETLDEFLSMTWAAFVDPTGYLTPLTVPVAPQPGLVAELRILGPSPMRITLHVDHEGARDVTSRMREEAAGVDVDEADITDALAELVNILGGNIKSLLPDGSVLTLPSVGTGVTPTSVADGDVAAAYAWGTCVITTHIEACLDPHPAAPQRGPRPTETNATSMPPLSL